MVGILHRFLSLSCLIFLRQKKSPARKDRAQNLQIVIRRVRKHQFSEQVVYTLNFFTASFIELTARRLDSTLSTTCSIAEPITSDA